jgi:DNA (cytosine-5)-methyltransferase 1
MRYGSVCSGVEAATVAWEGLGWKPQWFSEIEQFPSAVLNHHYPNIPNMGDMTKHKEWNNGAIELLVGGTPCQSFSVAGLRKGLDDPRGNLMLTYLAIAEQYRAKWLVWENVPGVLSSNGGKDFGAFLGALGQLGYGFGYRVLDAQYFGVPQRRKRVFVVGCLGDWRSAAAVLFESHSLQGHSAPSRKKGEKVAPSVTTGAPYSRTGNQRVECDAIIPIAFGGQMSNVQTDAELSQTLQAKNPQAVMTGQWPKDIACTLNAAFGSKMGLEDQHINGGASLFVPCAYDMKSAHNPQPTDTFALTTRNCSAIRGDSPLVAKQSFGIPGNWIGRKPENGGNAVEPHFDRSPCLTAADRHGVSTGTAVRRLTPTECERLQGFPDNYTKIPYRKKDADNCPDGPRYKAMGNSMAVPVMKWIGQRIQMVKEMKNGSF